MRILRVLLMLVALCVPVAAFAQNVPVATPTQSFAFDYLTADFSAGGVVRFEMQIDALAFVSVQIPAIVPNAPVGTVTYTVLIPAMTPGAHTVGFRACNQSGCSASSAPLAFTLMILKAPTGVRIIGG